MSRAIDVSIVVVVAIIVVEAALLSVPARGSTVHFAFPNNQDISKLLTGETLQNNYSIQNIYPPNLSNEYGLVKAQSASYGTNNYVTYAMPSVYITELKFNSQDNSTSFYKSQLFGSILTSKLPVSNSNLNISYGGAVYSIFPVGSLSQGYYYMIGYYSNFDFVLFLYSTQTPLVTLNGLAELVVQSMS